MLEIIIMISLILSFGYNIWQSLVADQMNGQLKRQQKQLKFWKDKYINNISFKLQEDE